MRENLAILGLGSVREEILLVFVNTILPHPPIWGYFIWTCSFDYFVLDAFAVCLGTKFIQVLWWQNSTALWGEALGLPKMQAVPNSGLWLCQSKQIVNYLPAASCHLQFVFSTEITLFWISQLPRCCEKFVWLLNILFTIWMATKLRTCVISQ